jgi:hypothetical protein
MTKYDIAANLTLFGKDYWTGRMSAKEQRKIFGEYLFGKKTITINCDNQGTVSYIKKPTALGSWRKGLGLGNTFSKSFNEIAKAVNLIKEGKYYRYSFI